MIRFVHANKEYKIRIDYPYADVPGGHPRHATRVSIRRGNNDEQLLCGEAICNPHDNFSKALGRKMALTRALKDFHDRQFRTAVWTAFKKGCRISDKHK